MLVLITNLQCASLSTADNFMEMQCALLPWLALTLLFVFRGSGLLSVNFVAVASPFIQLLLLFRMIIDVKRSPYGAMVTSESDRICLCYT